MYGFIIYIIYDDCLCVFSKGDVVEYFEILYYGVYFCLFMNG